MQARILEQLPDWAQDFPWRLIAVVAVLLAAFLVYRLLDRQVRGHVADPEKRHRYRKRVAYTIAAVVAVGLGIAFFERLREVGTLLGFIGAGLAIALREYLASFLAWFYIIGQRGIALGSRIEVSGVRGDVIDIGVFKITLVEVRGEGLGEQSSGRLVTVPNFKILTDPVFHFTTGSPFVWDEIDFTVTFESDWERAREIVEEVGNEVFQPHREEIETGFRRLESDYAFRYGVTTPIVYTSIGGSGINLRLRYLTHVRQRRGNRDAISRGVLARFRAESNIEFAYPTSRVYRTEIDVQRFSEPPRPEPRKEPEDPGR
ncbi:MAG TPA: mechanosensitive ion channel domain-containing protein [Gemmatimonadota bacterium]|nr:mechanosensitive ion channel domain-containing protein [Gemmatimonadota bacterium]